MRGDIKAGEIYQDRDLLNRIGYGIFDVQWGKDGGVGFEDVKNFSYVVAQDEDPKLYRRRVYDLVGRYYPNNLAKAVWDRFIDHKWILSERAGHEIGLREAADDWLEHFSHDFFKDWTFRQQEVPYRLKGGVEPSRSLMSLVASRLVPNLRELLDVGFTVTDILLAAVAESVPIPGSVEAKRERKEHDRPEPDDSQNPYEDDQARKTEDAYYVLRKIEPEGAPFFYVRLVAYLTGHDIKDQEEAEKRWQEILEHKWYMSERAGHDVGIRAAALDYYRRLNFVRDVEQG